MGIEVREAEEQERGKMSGRCFLEKRMVVVTNFIRTYLHE